MKVERGRENLESRGIEKDSYDSDDLSPTYHSLKRRDSVEVPTV
jgi:hypothetical protein